MITEPLRENPRTAVYFFDDAPIKQQPEGLQEKIAAAIAHCLESIARAFTYEK